jgi:PKD repeat protein
LSAGDTQFFEIDHVNRNGSGGYTWQFTNNFASNSAATAAFTRSLEEWRCETQMNWSLGANTSNDSRASDDDNIVRFTNFGDGKLGVCYSYRSGCFSGGSINWYTTELDIEFDSTYNWYYGTGTPPSGFYDFETVATHELGHGHQLGHVRDISKVMHFSIGPATRKAALVPEDIAAGVYVKDKSIASSPCGPSPMQAIPSGSCNLTPPISDFTISDTVVCPLDNVVFTNTTVGDPTSYAWNFSSQASPTTANTVGPHTVQFSSAGTHTIQLITSNSFGSDTVQKTITVKTATLASPGDFVSNDSGCLGFEDYTINAVTNAEGYQWTLSSGGTFVGATDQTTAQVEWTAAGQHIINVVAANECTVSDAQKDTVLIIASPTASFVGNDNSTTISFTNSSTNAETHYWEFGDGSTSTEDNPVHQYPDKGNYIVKYKVTNLCGADSVTQEFTLDFSAGINKVDRTWKLFPNPVQANSTLTVEGIAFDSYTLTDMNGRVIENQKANGNTVLVPSLNPGIYQIVIRKNQKQAVYSVVVIE